MEKIIKNDFIDYTEILLFSKTVKDSIIESTVPYSRFKIILSNYMCLNGLHFKDFLPEEEYDYYVITDVDGNNNTFKIIKGCDETTEVKTMLTKCSCGRRKQIDHEKCYYCRRSTENYTPNSGRNAKVFKPIKK